MPVTRLWLCLVILLASAPWLPAPILETQEAAKPKQKRTIKPKVTNENSETPTKHTSTHLANTTEVSKQPHKSKNNGGVATVFIYRPAGFSWGMYNGSVITIDGVKACTMADPRYSVRKLSPGKHVFEATGGVFTHQHISIPIDLQSDQNYYLRMTIDAMGFPEGKIIFTRAPNAQAVQELAKITQAP